MNLTQMLSLVRRDLHDEVSADYHWSDAELTRHIQRAVKEFSSALPLPQIATLPTLDGSREVDITGLADRIMIEAVEYPLGCFPSAYQRFALWDQILSILGPYIPNGSDCRVYYGRLHTLNESQSTLPAYTEDLVIAGSCGYAVLQMAVSSINQVNNGGVSVPAELLSWGQSQLAFFRSELKRLGRRNRVRVNQLYLPAYPQGSNNRVYWP